MAAFVAVNFGEVNRICGEVNPGSEAGAHGAMPIVLSGDPDNTICAKAKAADRSRKFISGVAR
jgi:hypothetical protein